MTPMTDEMNAAVAETDIETGIEMVSMEDSVSNGHPVGTDVYGGEDGAAQAVAARELQGIVESLLFVSQDPLSIQRLAAIIGDVSKTEIAQALQGLGEELAREGRGIRLVEIAGVSLIYIGLSIKMNYFVNTLNKLLENNANSISSS